MVRILSIIAGLVLVVVIAAVVLVPMFVDQDKVIALAADTLREETGATLEVNGELDITVFPVLGVSFTQATITMPNKTAPDLELGSANIGVQFMPLLRGQVQVNSIEVDGVTARLESAPDTTRIDTGTLSDAELEAYYAKRRQAQQAAQDAVGAEAALAVPLALSVARLSISNTRIETLDTATGQTSVMELLSLAARDLNLENRPIPLSATVRIPGQAPISIVADGQVQVDQDAEQARFNELAVTITGATAAPLELSLSGRYDLQRQAADADIQISAGEVQGAGTLRYASFESPQIDANLRMNLFDPVLFALAGPEAAQTESTDTPAEAPTGDEPLPLDALRAIDTRASLVIDTARFDQHDINDLTVKLRAKEGVVTLSELSGTVHGGQLLASATLNGRLSTATVETQGAVTALDLNAALSAAGVPDRVTGNATVQWQLTGSGKTANALTGSLAGPIELNTQDVTLKGTSVEKLVCQAVALTNQEKLTSTFAPDTPFTHVSASIALKDGVAALQPLRAELPNISLSGSGTFDLLKQDLNTTFKARLSPGLEELDSACRVSKRVSAIDFPVACRGNLAQPAGNLCAIDTEAIIRDMAVNEGRKKVEKEAGKLLNKFFGKE